MTRDLLLRGIRLFLAVLALLLSPAAAQTAGTDVPQGELAGKDAADVLEEKWGVRVVSLRLSAENHLIDFRYRVTNAGKAGEVLKRRNKASLIDQATGKTLAVPDMPKVGSLRQSTQKPENGKIYFILFRNPGIVKEGNKVTVAIGDFRAEDLTVQ